MVYFEDGGLITKKENGIKRLALMVLLFCIIGLIALTLPITMVKVHGDFRIHDPFKPLEGGHWEDPLKRGERSAGQEVRHVEGALEHAKKMFGHQATWSDADYKFAAALYDIAKKYNVPYTWDPTHHNFFIYNYCGPGNKNYYTHGKVCTIEEPSLNPVDAVCKFHDSCWCKYGDGNCQCNQEAVVKFGAAKLQTTDPVAQKVADVAIAVFSVEPCNPIPHGL